MKNDEYKRESGETLQLMCSSVQLARPKMYIFPLKPAKRVHDSVSQTDRKTWEAKFGSPERLAVSVAQLTETTTLSFLHVRNDLSSSQTWTSTQGKQAPLIFTW